MVFVTDDNGQLFFAIGVCKSADGDQEPSYLDDAVGFGAGVYKTWYFFQ